MYGTGGTETAPAAGTEHVPLRRKGGFATQAVVELRPVTEVLEEMEFIVPQHHIGVACLTSPVQVGIQQVIDGIVFYVFRSEPIQKLSDVKGAAYAFEVAPQREIAIDRLTLCDYVQVLPLGEQQVAPHQEIEVPPKTALRPSNSLPNCPDLTEGRRVKGDDAVSFAQIGSLENNSLGFICTWLSHLGSERVNHPVVEGRLLCLDLLPAALRCHWHT